MRIDFAVRELQSGTTDSEGDELERAVRLLKWKRLRGSCAPDAGLSRRRGRDGRDVRATEGGLAGRFALLWRGRPETSFMA